MGMKVQSLDKTNEIVLRNACALSKSNFIFKYMEMGFDSQELGPAWHELRTSQKGIELLKKPIQKRYEAPAEGQFNEKEREFLRNNEKLGVSRGQETLDKEAATIQRAKTKSKRQEGDGPTKSEQIKALYAEGKSVSQISKQLETHYSYVHTVVAKIKEATVTITVKA